MGEFLFYYISTVDTVYEQTGLMTAEEANALYKANYEWQNDMAQNEQTAALVSGSEDMLRKKIAEAEGAWKQAEKNGVITLNLPMLKTLADLIIEGKSGITGLYVDENTQELYVRVLLLEERYKPENGESLRELAESWEDYQNLTEDVCNVIRDIAYNYEEYLNFKEQYVLNGSNIACSFDMYMMGDMVEVSNLTEDIPKAERDAYFKEKYGKYIIYAPQKVEADTNIGTMERWDNILYYAFADYAYAYPEEAQMWIGVDTSYPVHDAFYEAAKAYSFLHAYSWILSITAAVSAMVWLVLFVFLNIEARGLKRFDAVPTEILLLLMLLLAFVIRLLIWQGKPLIYNGFSGVIGQICADGRRIPFSMAAGAAGLLISMTACLFWYSFIRRCKARTLWKNSICRSILQPVKKWSLHIYDNSGIWLQGVLRVGVVMLINLVLGALMLAYMTRWHRGMSALFAVGLVAADGFILFVWVTSHIRQKRLLEGISRIKNGEIEYQVDTEGLHGENLKLAEAVNSIGEGLKNAVETSMKDERLKADLITNVSHDIKTPLTSIINYVDLLKREGIEEEPIKGYISVLEAKAHRLKQLTDDLVEASKISSGNITLIMEKINLTELLAQTVGEFSEKFTERELTLMDGFSGEPVFIEADSRRIFRVIENLFGNVCKYAQPGTRVYLDKKIAENQKSVSVSLKNISAQPLNIPAEELTERFIRGDVSRGTEGSGLGLSIAKNLTVLQNGSFDIYLDGDLFKVILTFPIYED